ncbi:MAG: peptidoglycan editing factor PgeF [Nitrospirae bacterium]|nr:peptidoglycan editing factor PgeF [Nitrospirota bacterium]
MQNDIIEPEILSGHKVRAFFTGKYTGSDLSMLSKVSGLSGDRMYLPIQKHTDKIITIINNMEQLVGDAVVTGQKDILLGVKTADCVPILLYDKKRHVAAAVHAGWRGTAASILKKTVDLLKIDFQSDPLDILMAIGPCIRQCCYTVDIDVIDAVSAATGDGDYCMQRDGKYYIDLQSANRQQAILSGMNKDHIQVIDECTFCNPDKYFSYRFLKEEAGRQGGFIAVL